jgi:uncharacterized protein (DUF2384 family)
VGRHKVFKRAEEIFHSADKATIWVNKPNTALGGQSPVQAIETEEGFFLVLDELGRTELVSATQK